MLNTSVLQLYQSIADGRNGRQNGASLFVRQDLSNGDLTVLARQKEARVAVSLSQATTPAAATEAQPFENPAQREAADTIVRILLDAKGNATVTVKAEDSAMAARLGKGDDTLTADVAKSGYVSTGRGDDVIAIRASLAEGVAVDMTKSGKGDDTVTISSAGRVDRTDLGRGDDTLAISSQTDIDRTRGGRGDDVLTLAAKGNVDRTYGGSGDDEMLISADEGVWLADGGSGDDTMTIRTGGAATGILGGYGDDTIDVEAETAAFIDGGEGDDTIRVSAANIESVAGGLGDDTIVLDSTEGGTATVYMAEGDGADTIEANGPVALVRVSEDGSAKLDPALATVTENDDGTFSVSFEGSNDTVTLRFTGDMEGKQIVAESVDGALVFSAVESAEIPGLSPALKQAA